MPGVAPDGRIVALPSLDARAVTACAARSYIDNAWLIDDALFASLDGEEAWLLPAWHGLRRPQAFYYGHNAAFYTNKLVMAGLLDESERVRPDLDVLFEMGVDENPWDDMSRNESPWPSVEEVHGYRRATRELIDRALDRAPELAGGSPARVDARSPLWALLMAVEHQRIHVETSSVLIREMPNHLVQTAPHLACAHPTAARPCVTAEPVAGRDFPDVEMLTHCGGTVALGRRDHAEFGWDLEFGAQDAAVAPFALSSTLVTNGDLAAFIAAGGYAEQRFWSIEGWDWRSRSGACAPTFWEEGNLDLRLCFESVPMQWDWPAVVNRHEAQAFLAWKSGVDGAVGRDAYRLLTEAELALVRAEATAAGQPGGANTGLVYTSESPVRALEPAATGHHDLLGSLWEHCNDAIGPLDATFEAHPLYRDFSEPAFDGRHFVLSGASFASTGTYAGAATRNYFRPHFFQHAGFRVARTL